MRWLPLVMLLGCVDKGPGPQPKKIDPKSIAANLATTMPPDLAHLDVALGAPVVSVIYVGNTTPAPLVPGSSTRITHVWKVQLPPGPGWRVFAQLRGEAGTADFMNLDATDMELGHPVESWKAGEIILDPLEFTLRPDWKSKSATLQVGLIRNGGHDTGDRMVATGPNTLDNAVIAKSMIVDLQRAPPPPGTVYIPHATGPIVVDGIATEGGWGIAINSQEFATADGSTDPVGSAKAKVAWDEDNLYVYVTIVDTDIVSRYTKHDEPLYKDDAVEIFIDADGNRRGYVELQVSPANVTFDKWWPATRNEAGDETWDSNMVTAVKLRGTVAPGDADQGWDVEIAIPWAAVKGRDEAMKINSPPHVGDRWHMNIVRTNQRTGGTNQAEGGASSWNRISVADFHALDKTMTIVFADRTGSILPAGSVLQAGLPVPEVPAGSGSGSGSARK